MLRNAYAALAVGMLTSMTAYGQTATLKSVVDSEITSLKDTIIGIAPGFLSLIAFVGAIYLAVRFLKPR